MKTDDPELLKIKEKVLNDSQRKEQAAWEDTLSRESGRRVLWQLMDEFGLFKYGFDGTQGNGQKIAENVARQGCAQFIKNRIAFWGGGDYWMTMEREAMSRMERDSSEIERQTQALEKKRGQKP